MPAADEMSDVLALNLPKKLPSIENNSSVTAEETVSTKATNYSTFQANEPTQSLGSDKAEFNKANATQKNSTFLRASTVKSPDQFYR